MKQIQQEAQKVEEEEATARWELADAKEKLWRLEQKHDELWGKLEKLTEKEKAAEKRKQSFQKMMMLNNGGKKD